MASFCLDFCLQHWAGFYTAVSYMLSLFIYWFTAIYDGWMNVCIDDDDDDDIFKLTQKLPFLNDVLFMLRYTCILNSATCCNNLLNHLVSV